MVRLICSCPAARAVVYVVVATMATPAVGHTWTAGEVATRQAGDLRIVVLDGEDSVNIIEQGTAVPTLVEVRDRNDLPVSGASVTFLLGEGGTATLNAGLSQVAVTTNALGQAAVTVNPIASGAVQLQVTAAFQGQTATAAIVQTNFATLAEAAAAGAGATGGAGGGGGGGTGAAGGAAGGAGGGLGTGAIVGIAAAGAGAAVGGVTLAGGDDARDTGPGGPVTNGSPNRRPTAVLSIAPDALGMAELTEYRFSASGSSDPDGDALSYAWDFGDGQRASGATATHRYNTPGAFTVVLTVRDDGGSATATGAVTVGDLTAVWVTGPHELDPDDPTCGQGMTFMELTQNRTALEADFWEQLTTTRCFDEDRWSYRGTIASSNNFVCPCRIDLGEVGGEVLRDLNTIVLRAEGQSARFRRQ